MSFFLLFFFILRSSNSNSNRSSGGGGDTCSSSGPSRYVFFFFFSIYFCSGTHVRLFVRAFFFLFHAHVRAFFFLNSLLANPPVSFIASNSRFPWHAILRHATQLSAAFFVCSVICLTHHASYIHIFFSLINDHSNS